MTQAPAQAVSATDDQDGPEILDPKGEFPFALPSYAFHLAIVINRHREMRMERLLRPLGSNFVRHRTLSVINRMQTCTMSDLADFTSADRTTMTRIVDQLVESGLVVRSASATDRRQVLLSLTPQGQAIVDEAMVMVRKFNADAVAGIPEEELRAAMRVYERIAANAIENPDQVERLLLRSGIRRNKAEGGPSPDTQRGRLSLEPRVGS